ncbi:hypothetical protein V1525DRAFT_409433 [Lipomyces kononenkoae]|uniref:Uncharacterized protein n=1 Tax=Lipomyces kononenkoae TaxID=34357 RepID=A0ACC3SW10_LIPKO
MWPGTFPVDGNRSCILRTGAWHLHLCCCCCLHDADFCDWNRFSARFCNSSNRLRTANSQPFSTTARNEIISSTSTTSPASSSPPVAASDFQTESAHSGCREQKSKHLVFVLVPRMSVRINRKQSRCERLPSLGLALTSSKMRVRISSSDFPAITNTHLQSLFVSSASQTLFRFLLPACFFSVAVGSAFLSIAALLLARDYIDLLRPPFLCGYTFGLEF